MIRGEANQWKVCHFSQVCHKGQLAQVWGQEDLRLPRQAPGLWESPPAGAPAASSLKQKNPRARAVPAPRWEVRSPELQCLIIRWSHLSIPGPPGCAGTKMQRSGPGLLFSDSVALSRAQESAFSLEAQGLLDANSQACARAFIP